MLQFGLIVCVFFCSALSPRPAINRFNLCTVPEKLTTLQAATQKVGGKKRISGRIRMLYSQSDFKVKKITFWPAFFFKHKLHLILPKIMQKNLEIG
jgi:hypothetical protein